MKDLIFKNNKVAVRLSCHPDAPERFHYSAGSKNFPLGADLGRDADIIEVEVVKKEGEEKKRQPEAIVIVRGGVVEVISRPGVYVDVIDFDNLDEATAKEKEALIAAMAAERGKEGAA